ncbi:MAG: hypothetical protein AAB589_00160, partial [Patescibacteria group bacterium]
MSLEQKSKLIQTAKTLSLALILTLGAHLAMANWTPPPNAPTTCDSNPSSPNYEPGCALPINVSDIPQTKTGFLQVGKLISNTNLEFFGEIIPPTPGTGVGGACVEGQTIKKNDDTGEWECTYLAPGLWVFDGIGSIRPAATVFDEVRAVKLRFEGELLPGVPGTPACNPNQTIFKYAPNDWRCTSFAPGYWILDGGGPGLTTDSARDVKMLKNILLPNTDPAGTGGVIKFGGQDFIHNRGSDQSLLINTFIGAGAGVGTGDGGLGNVGVGTEALTADNMTGLRNIAIGYASLSSLTGGNNNIAIGYSAGGNLGAGGITASHNNIAIGKESLYLGDGGDENVLVGNDTMRENTNTTSDYNVGIGQAALRVNVAPGLVAVGKNALTSNTSGVANVAVGYGALAANITSASSTAVGYQALANSTAGLNTAIGSQALRSNTAGTSNTAIGWRALYELDGEALDDKNTVIGAEASDYFEGDSNTIIGFNAVSNPLSRQARGNGNVVVGAVAAQQLGDNASAGSTATSYGNNNTIVGHNAGPTLVSGDSNTLLGNGADVTASGVIDAVALGQGSLANSTSTAVGRNSNAAGFNSVVIGANAFATGNNSVVIGTNAASGGSDVFILGSSATKVGIRNTLPISPFQLGSPSSAGTPT